MRSSARTMACLLALWVGVAAPGQASDRENEWLTHPLRQQITDALVRPADRRTESWRWQREPDLLVLYFGASWCGPCHAFVPTLREVYEQLRAAGADTEVVFVSLDESERDMRRYMRQQAMPWPAIDHRRLPAMPALRRLGGIAPPNLVVLARDGDVLASGWDGRRYAGLAPVLHTWTEHAESGVTRDTQSTTTPRTTP